MTRIEKLDDFKKLIDSAEDAVNRLDQLIRELIVLKYESIEQ